MEKPKEEFKHLVRISNTDIDGNKNAVDGVRKIKGISFTFANAVFAISGVDKRSKLGNLNDAQIKKIEDVITDAHSKMPQWLLNRRRNIEDDSSVHMVTTNLTFAHENDIRQMQRIRSYRGIRHMAGAPVRGQRTRSNFRKNKGKVLGVAKSKIAQSASKDKDKK